MAELAAVPFLTQLRRRVTRGRRVNIVVLAGGAFCCCGTVAGADDLSS